MGSAKHANDASRAERKLKKRKLEDAIPDLPGDLDARDESENISSEGKKALKKRKRGVENGGDMERSVNEKGDERDARNERKEKKRLKKELAAQALEEDAGGEQPVKKKGNKTDKSNDVTDVSRTEDALDLALEADTAPKKSKKERKAERKAAEAASKMVTSTGSVLEADGSPAEEAEKRAKKNNRNREKKRKAGIDKEDAPATSDSQTAEGKAPRFIVFIGNLPFTATTESIQKHFAAVKPKSVRHLTQKDNPTKSKGCAFIEFDGYDHMKTCLKLFHHSSFDDGISPPRKINVELTAGGGGNTKDRRAKIEEKNQKLNEQRIRRIQEEAKTKGEKRDVIDETAIHPSRRGRVPGA